VNLLLSAKKNTIILFLIIIIPFSLFSEELTRKELNEMIDNAQILFDNQEYDKAIQLLSEIVESSPERLDQAVSLINKITDIRNLYNKKMGELITALYDDEDYEKALKLIEELEELEKNPNEVSTAAIRNARISAELVYNKVKLRELMDEAKRELDLEAYSKALAIYQSGFKLGRQTYEESELISDIEKNAVLRSIDEIHTGALNYINNGELLVNQTERFKTMFSRSKSTDLTDDLSQLMNLFNNFSKEKETLLLKSKILDESLYTITSIDKYAPERFFLDFSNLLIHGRNEVDFFEGIISSTDQFWENEFIKLSNLINSEINSSYNNAVAEYKNEDYEKSSKNFDDVLKYAKYSSSIYALLNNRITLKDNFSFDLYSKDLIQKYYGLLADSRVFARVTDSYKKMIDLQKGQFAYVIRENLELDDLYNLRLQIIKEIPIIENEEDLWKKISSSLNWLDSYNAQPVKGEDITILVKNDLAELLREMEGINVSILTRVTDQEYKRIVGKIEDFRSDFDYNKNFIDGYIDDEIVNYTGDNNITSSFPDRALPNLVKLIELLLSLSDEIENVLDTFKTDDSDSGDKAKIEEFIKKTELLFPQITVLIDSSSELETKARDNIFTAEGYENQGNKLVENVRSIVNNSRAGRSDFDRARENLKDANTAFFQSLFFKENLTLRKRVDNDIAGLQEALLDGENRLVVVDVRNYINRGKEQYINRKYGESRIFLERAQNRWLTTNTDEHPEILYWMALVDLALQFDRGRTISKTEPLYDEMMQFLNLAKSNYNRGVDFIDLSEMDKGKTALNKAVENLEHVRISMPQNEMASLLLLKIEQLRDPQSFRESFSVRIDEAWEKLQSGNKTKQGEGYIELIDLSKIDSGYPGLQNKIAIAEYDILKTRRRPPDPKDLNESVDLYKNALEIVEGGVRSQFEIAVTWLDQAIALNPNNTLAINLKDRIQVEGGGKVTIVLPSALLSRFNSAVEEFNKGNYLNAYAIIQELKKDRRSVKYPPLLKLEERVKLKLQI